MRNALLCWAMTVVPGNALADSAAEWTYQVTSRGNPAVGERVGLQVISFSRDAALIDETAFANSDSSGVVQFPRAAVLK